ncbi:MAG: ferrochelatase [Kofleriaceae bacterium]|nr:ferrochelatase [Kofleriaceae bacterium]MCL4228047.1 ferrochelatase [Myxococcales bacterium]
MATGLLLINLGTPDAPTPAAVRRYLREFLSDPRVIDMNAVGRKLLLELVILPTRPRKSAHAYQQIWDARRGSPLLFHGQDLAAGVAARLGDDWRVELGMRYGSPSLGAALDRLIAAEVTRIVALPLYPQYASSSTGSSLEHLYRLAAARTNVPPLVVVPPFYADDGFLGAFAAVARPQLAAAAAEHVLFSFHGLPEHHMRAGDPSGQHCLASPSCCDAPVGPARDCYRAQCYATARALAARLGLVAEGWSVAFQSRLGRVPWIKPYTDEALPALARQGVRKIAVMCPAFVADCLETLEEIGMRAATQWQADGGERLTLVSSLNAEPGWLDAVAELARRAAPRLPVAA